MRIYGVAEIAEEVGARPETVAQWLYRKQMPEPNARLKMGPVWYGRTIQKWIEERTGK